MMTYAVALIATVIAAAALASIVLGLFFSFWHLRGFQKTKIDIKKARQKWIKKYMKKFG